MARDYTADIALELRQIRKVLERIARAPSLSLDDKKDITCPFDEKSCGDCPLK